MGFQIWKPIYKWRFSVAIFDLLRVTSSARTSAWKYLAFVLDLGYMPSVLQCIIVLAAPPKTQGGAPKL